MVQYVCRSLSFVMVTSCFAFSLLSTCYYLIDVKRWWSGKPVLFAGMNAILLYAGKLGIFNFKSFTLEQAMQCGCVLI